MTNPEKTVENLLRLAAPNSGATAPEAALSAKRAWEIAAKNGLPGSTRARAHRLARQSAAKIAA